MLTGKSEWKEAALLCNCAKILLWQIVQKHVSSARAPPGAWNEA